MDKNVTIECCEEIETNYINEKKHLLMVVNDIYDSLLDIASEVEKQANHIKHLKGIIKKDLLVRSTTPYNEDLNYNLQSIRMSRQEWLEYVEKSNSNNNSDQTESNKEDSPRCSPYK